MFGGVLSNRRCLGAVGGLRCSAKSGAVRGATGLVAANVVGGISMGSGGALGSAPVSSVRQDDGSISPALAEGPHCLAARAASSLKLSDTAASLNSS